MLALIHYDSSPVGPYNELSVGTLSGHGPTVTAMVVNSEASMIGGRTGWGFPKELGQLQWERQVRRVTFVAASRRWRVRAWGAAFPMRANLWSVQTLDGQKVKVPIRVAGHLRLALQGRRLGLLIESLVMTVLPPVPID